MSSLSEPKFKFKSQPESGVRSSEHLVPRASTLHNLPSLCALSFTTRSLVYTEIIIRFIHPINPFYEPSSTLFFNFKQAP